MKTNNAHNPIRIAKLIALAVFTFSGILYLIPSDSHALSPNATIRLCERNFIGANYKPHLESKCGLIWEKLTFEIMQSFNQ
jgi:hypothetical protein